jgi:hypothetical protein
VKPKYLAMLLALAFCIGVAGLLVWFWPLNGATAIDVAKSKHVYQLQDETWGEFIADYEEATGTSGTWHAKRPYNEQWSWDVTYTHPGIGLLWLGVGHHWTALFTHETTAGQVQRMLTGQRIE